MRHATLSALMFVAALACVEASAQSPSAPPPPPAIPTMQAMPFMQIAGESDVYEVTSSTIAIKRAQNPEVRAFAAMLADHHTRTTNVLLTQASAAKLAAPPAVLGADTRRMIDALYAASPADFDRIYLQQQIPAHEQALAVHTAYARGGDTPQLKEAAAGAVPIVQQHLARARTLSGAPS